MNRPRHWEHGDGKCNVATPPASAFGALRDKRITMDEYRERCEAWWLALEEISKFVPGRMRCVIKGEDGRHSNWAVEDGDTLLCACARPGSPRRTHECHLEWLAPFLVRAGWRVVLYGSEVTP